MTERAPAHREVVELLPWYVNGTLGDDERRRLERHLGDCLPCNAALRDERRLSGLLREQDTVPLGPEHGLNALNARIDGRARAPIGRGFRALPGLGYGIAAALGGAIVWFWLGSNPAGVETDPGFATLTTPAADARGDIDIVFAVEAAADAVADAAADAAGDTAAASAANALAAFAREYELRLVAGPSALGRYTFAVADREPAAIDRLLAALGEDPRVRFAGRAYTADVAEEAGAQGGGGAR